MNRLDTPLPGACLLEPTVVADDRGWFYESWNQHTLAGLGIDTAFVQDNHSCSRRGVLRGLHWQAGAAAQGKLVRCVHGAIFDAIVDVRRGSSGFGRWFGTRLDAENRCQLWIPPGFAHGFLALSELAEVCYKATAAWSREAERGLRWDDPAVAIAWPDAGAAPLLHPRDAAFPTLDRLAPGDLC
jgi:dTDP-4-dehydrorhamnose 3,5-epimerase